MSSDNKTDSTDKSNLERRLLGYLRPLPRTPTFRHVRATTTGRITALLAFAIKLSVTHLTEGEVGRLNIVCIVVVFVFLIKRIVAYGETCFLSLVALRIAAGLRRQ